MSWLELFSYGDKNFDNDFDKNFDQDFNSNY